jgi:hypothetical protein
MANLINVPPGLPANSPVALYINAVNTVASDVETVGHLTETGVNLLAAIQSITGDVVTSTALATTQAVSEVGAEIAGDVADAVGAVLDIVPVIGAFVAAVIKIVALVAGANAASEAEQAQVVAAGANGFMQTARPFSPDASTITPAGYFVPIYQVDPTFDDNGQDAIVFRPQIVVPSILATGKLTPLNNQFQISASMLVNNPTSGMSALGWGIARACSAFGLHGGSEVDLLLQVNGAAGTNFGIPQARRAIYRGLMHAIAAQYGIAGSNEGTELWILLIEMILQDVQNNRLNAQFISYMMSAPVAFTGDVTLNTLLAMGAPDAIKVLGSGVSAASQVFMGQDMTGAEMSIIQPDDYADYGIANFAPLASQIIAIAEAWRVKNNPVTASDQAAFAKSQAALKAAAANPGGIFTPDQRVIRSLITHPYQPSPAAPSLQAAVALNALRRGIKPPPSQHLIVNPSIIAATLKPPVKAGG